MGDWTQQSHILADHVVPGVLGAVTSLYFDPYAELMWAGSASGQLTSHTNTPPTHARYSSFAAHGTPAHPSPVRGILADEKYVMSIGSDTMRATQRTGLGQWSVPIQAHAPGLELAGMCASPHSTDIIVGGATASAAGGTLADSPVLLAIHDSHVLRTAPSDAAITHILKAGKYVCTGTEQGTIQLRDPRTLSIEHKLMAHHGGLIDVQAEGSLLYSIGWTLRQGHRIAEPLIKVHDLRTLQPLVPIPMTAPGGPAFLAVHPKRASMLAVATHQAQFQIVDTHNPGQSQFYMLPSASYVSALTFSSSAEVLAFGESDGSVRLWTNDKDAAAMAAPMRFNTYPTQPLAMPEYVSTPRMEWKHDTPLSCIGMPYYDHALFSAMPSEEYWSQGTALLTMPAPLDPAVLDSVHFSGGIGYAPLPRHLRGKRNLLLGTDDLTDRFDRSGKLKRTALARLRSKHGDRRVHLARFHSQKAGDADEAPGADGMGMPDYCRQLTIQYSRFGVEDFDFASYNKTPFAGLETNIENAYANAYLQALHYTRPLRAFALRHILMPCAQPKCLLCEAGFLFRMLDDAQGTRCQAANLLHTLKAMPNVATLGVLDGATTNETSRAYSELAQTLNHFILDTFSHEAMRLQHHFQQLCANPCAFAVETKTVCTLCGYEKARQHGAHVVDLLYPSAGAVDNLAQLLAPSLARETMSKSRCRRCHAPHAVHSTFSTVPSMDALPDVLSINAGVYAANQLAHWKPRANEEEGFVPPCMWLDVEHGRLVAQGVYDDAVPKRACAMYSIRALTVQIQGANDAPHLCTFVRAPGEVDAWYVFNDFLVRPVRAQDALCFGPSWKIPAVLFYERVDAAACAREQQLVQWSQALHPDYDLLLHDTNLAKHRDPALMRQQVLDVLPSPGTLVAIDTEFVALASEEVELCSDGTRSVIRPSMLGLARVSVLRGEGPQEGVAFIDDHIHTVEPVVDYLTQYSGIQPGDLDPATTKYTLVSHKMAYKKLRILVDRGCRFIGHGLAKDFRIINIFVPPSQVIDTVNLFHSPAHPRNLSLRFLAWFLLKRDIQSGLLLHEGHDSIEDADAALQLYRSYEQFEQDNRLEDVLEDLYEMGPRTSWRPPVKTDG
ncbi:poly(A)-specific ribonuclease [Malassezia vespertilionis]|uniref:PAN2-PAN3 deadenylation complex catalytic subunit PAN2 n=1 Tax=Malassezia vespertilionis TaxID=2020962 RepID=A0A2N1JCC3_9BASI|nr:poly(A)-specific ribonuclease [Malassezia vespertilionis]PKI84195.1 Pan2p [Malassezia vespertilionis]WFD06982.1 poly(A)-specific ribonuclease [Malassezia vespertilionis]